MDEVSRAAALAKIKLSDDEKLKAAGDLEKMLGYFEILKSADLSGISADEETVPEYELREDVPSESAICTGIMDGAPDAADGMFMVPGTVKAEG
ncbi:MAG: Asp-tRNA(Asn)/Glu-tRNA(Gln) amidotransferase subunit GatC [Lachnospiraceae bacterium]|nr:Asp-tRNA(Asn)/Glu-tRNA(Gln) amidotransferase subunit GatC [Lachnospiraceae bacterium]